MQDLYEIIPGKFYFMPISKTLRPVGNEFMLMTVDESNFPKIATYFGPPNISDIYKYCANVQYILMNTEYKIIHWSSYLNNEIFTNSLFLIGAFMLIIHKKSPKEVMEMIKKIGGKHLISFRDAVKNIPTPLQMDFYLSALQKAIRLQWFDLLTFSSNEYDRLATIKGGDMNWIVPEKFLALSHPTIYNQPIKVYVDYFKKNDIFGIVQLNENSYDTKPFEIHGIHHFDMPFTDGTPPDRTTAINFLTLTECVNGAFAVHCHAGLGRTGTLIAAYIISNYNFSAKEAIAWVRLCRPGSIIGVQQRFLELNYDWISKIKIICNDFFEKDFQFF